MQLLAASLFGRDLFRAGAGFEQIQLAAGVGEFLFAAFEFRFHEAQPVGFLHTAIGFGFGDLRGEHGQLHLLRFQLHSGQSLQAKQLFGFGVVLFGELPLRLRPFDALVDRFQLLRVGFARTFDLGLSELHPVSQSRDFVAHGRELLRPRAEFQLGEIRFGAAQLRFLRGDLSVQVGRLELHHRVSLGNAAPLFNQNPADEAGDRGMNFVAVAGPHLEVAGGVVLHRYDEDGSGGQRSAEQPGHHSLASGLDHDRELAFEEASKHALEREQQQQARGDHPQRAEFVADILQHPKKDDVQKTNGERPRHRAVPEQHAAARLRLRAIAAPQPATQKAHEVFLRSPSQIRQAQPITDEVVAIQPQQRIEVDEAARPANRHHDERQIIDEAIRDGDPPHEDRQCPLAQIAIASGRRDQ